MYLFLAVLGLHFCVRAFSSFSERGPLFIAVRRPLTVVASLIAEHRLQTHKLSSCGSRAQLLRGMWDLPRPGLEPVSPALAGRFSTTAPPGKPSRVFFISEIVLYIFDWIIFIISTSLLKWSTFILILFLYSFSIIFITNFLNPVSGRLIISVSLFFQVFSLALSIGSSSSAFIFYLTFFVSMNFGETFIYCELEKVFLCGGVVSVFRLCVPRNGFDVDTSHAFPQDVLASITLIESVPSVGGAKAWAGCEVRLPLCSIAVASLSGAGSASPVNGVETLRVGLK